MPMFNSAIPNRLRPWIYVAIAFCFQLSGVIYSNSVAAVMGEYSLMREDVLMIVMCSVIGIGMPFPLLFRMKFAFPNRKLLINAALVVAACNMLATVVSSVPALCIIAFLGGFFKICGTFECSSNIQLWMTPKRDFTIFFPLLFMVVDGNMALAPLISTHLAYAAQDWRAMNYLIAAIMLAIALFLFFATNNFHFMKPVPFRGADVVGMLLWAALLIEVVFLFNYGEYYNWLDGQVFRTVAAFVPITAILAIHRMLTVQQPYIEARVWREKHLYRIFAICIVVECINATPKVLQNAYIGGILHYGHMQTVGLYALEWMGTIAGCLFSLYWFHVLRQTPWRLMTVGFIALLVYETYMYLTISPDASLQTLYFPEFIRSFGIAIFMINLTLTMEESLPFETAFMGLGMLAFFRNGLVSTMASAFFSRGIRLQVADNLARGLNYTPSDAFLIALKQLFGLACVALSIVILISLVVEAPQHSTLRKIPAYNFVGRYIKKKLRRAEFSQKSVVHES